MTKHELVDIQKQNQHQRNAIGGKSPSGRNQQTHSSQNLSLSAQPHQGPRMGIVIGHDVEIWVRVPKVVDAAGDIKQGLYYEGNPAKPHAG